MTEALESALREVRDTLLREPVSPRVETPADINLHYCRYVAEAGTARLPDESGIEIVEDGGRGYMHTWIVQDGRHYDAECIDGVDDHRELPFFERHPEAAVHVEPETADPIAVRNRGRAPLYPGPFSRESKRRRDWMPSKTYRMIALAGVLLGLGLFALGFGGVWAVQHHLVSQSGSLLPLFVDLERIGELVAVTSPIVFFAFLPGHRAI